MDRESIDAFMAERRNGVLATVNRRGEPVQVPVFFDWHEVTIYISVTTQRGFYPNLRRKPEVSLCDEDAGRPARTVITRGEARVIEDESNWTHTRRIIDKYVPASRSTRRSSG